MFGGSEVGEALAIVSLGFFAANALLVGVASRRLAQQLGFLVALAANVVFAGAVVLVQLLLRAAPLEIDWGAVGLFAAGGLLTSYIGRRLFFRSVQEIGPSRASVIQVTNPLFAGLIGWLLLDESLSVVAIALVFLAVVGLLLTSQPGVRSTTGTPPEPSVTPHPEEVDDPNPARSRHLAIVGGLAGAIAYGAGNVVRGAGVREWNEPIIGSFIGALAGMLCYAIIHVDLRALAADLRASNRSGIRLWVLSGCLTISAQTALIAAMQHIEVVVSVVISAALPLVIMPVSVLFLKNQEQVSGRTVTGSALILIAVVGLALT